MQTKRLICCHSNPVVRHDKIFRCNGCGNLWHSSCYKACCKDKGVGLAFWDEKVMSAYNARVSFKERERA